MKIATRFLRLATALAGLAMMGAGPAPAPRAATDAAKAAVAKVFPTPRLFRAEIVHQAPLRTDTVQMCMGAETMRPFLEAAKAHPELGAQLNKGYTHSRVQTRDGGVKIEMACDKAAGATWAMRMATEGAGDEPF